MFSRDKIHYNQLDGHDTQALQRDEEASLNERPYRRSSGISPLGYMCLCSVFLNAFLCLRPWIRTGKEGHDSDRILSKFAKLAYDSPTAVTYHDAYWIGDKNVSDALWESIDTDPLVVTLSQEEIAEYGLPPSDPFPWDQSRSMYMLQSYHLLHCLKNIYNAYRTNDFASNAHIGHCLDSLRQYVQCHADDTPMATDQAENTIGEHQTLQCRSMDALRDWAREGARHSCYRMVNDYGETSHPLEKYAYCPDDSPYFGTMKEYFEEYGHDALFFDPELEAKFRASEKATKGM